MSLDYIRGFYGVPAHEGTRVAYSHPARVRYGRIVGASGSRLLVRFDDKPHGPLIMHPTWEITYLASAGSES